jgi:5-methylcytosine-specific restriction protein A
VKAKPWGTSTRKARLPPNWPQLRRYVLARDGGVCYVCRQPGADQVDHLVAGDDHREENLRAIHSRPCHARKSSSEGGAAAAAVRPSTKRPPERHPGLL